MEIFYKSKLFSSRHSLEYKLSIQSDLNGFSFCVYDFSRDTFLFLRHIPFEQGLDKELCIKQLDAIVKEEEIFTYKFRQVNFIFFSPNFSVIPEELAKEHDLKNYLKFQHEINEYDELHYENLSQIKTSVAFTIPSELTNVFVNRYEIINYQSQYSVLLKIAYNILVRENLSELCLIHKSESFFDIVIYKDKKLELCNSFKYVTENDLVYYCVNALRSLGVAETNIPVYYSGRFRSKGQDTLLLDKFIKVFKKNEPLQIKKSNNVELFSKHSIHYFTPLYFVNV